MSLLAIFGLAVLATTVAAVGAVASAPTRTSDNAIAAFFPPWWTSAEAFAAAGSAGPILAAGGWPTIVLLPADQPDLRRRLRAAGALLVIDAASTLCSDSVLKRT